MIATPGSGPGPAAPWFSLVQPWLPRGGAAPPPGTTTYPDPFAATVTTTVDPFAATVRLKSS